MKNGDQLDFNSIRFQSRQNSFSHRSDRDFKRNSPLPLFFLKSTTGVIFKAVHYAEVELIDLVDGKSSEATYCASLESDNYCFGLEATERFHDF